MKSKKTRSALKFSASFRRKLGEKQKKIKRSSLKFSPISRRKLGEEQQKNKRFSLKFSPIFKKKVFTQIQSNFQKKRSSLKFSPIFKKKGLHSNSVRFQPVSVHEMHRTCLLCDETSCPTCKGGGGHASILLTFLCNFATLPTQRGEGLGTMPPPKYAPAYCTSVLGLLHTQY